jgi:hypothetical protein
MHCIARAGMRKLEVEQRTSRKRGAGPFEPDPGRGQFAEIGPSSIIRGRVPQRTVR